MLFSVFRMAVASMTMAFLAGPAWTQDLKIGQTESYSGPAAQYGVIGKTQAAYFKMLNDKGGINGHKIEFLSVDDGYSPPKTVEQTRKLVEQDGVLLIFNSLGTATSTSVQKYLNQKKIPQLFIASGADKWGNYENLPFTIGWQPSYRTEGQIYAKFIQQTKPDAKIAVLYQNDDFGKDYLLGLKEALGAQFATQVTVASYESTDATIDSQIVSLKSSGADVFVTATTPKFAAMAIRKLHDLDWHPLHFMSNTSISVGAVLEPAGVDNAKGMISAAYLKDPTDPTWKEDRGMKEWRDFINSTMPGSDMTDVNLNYGYATARTLEQVLRQCGNDFSRENIMKQATNLKDIDIPMLLPGIKINTSPTNYHPLRQLQLQRWDGKNWVLFGKIIEGAG